MVSAIVYDQVSNQWLRFTKPISVVSAATLGEVKCGLKVIEDAVNEQGVYAVGFLSYEAAPAFDNAFIVRSDDGDFPLLWFGLFTAPEKLAVLPEMLKRGYTLTQWRPSITDRQYGEAAAKIRAFLKEGESYQVNFSYRLNASFEGDAESFFCDLYSGQPSSFAAYLDCGRFVICSASPELFFSLEGDEIVSCPMKGTAPRGHTLAQDRQIAEQLKNSPKNQSENVMIVDMIRNDLSRVAVPGSVETVELFAVERHPTLWQMTSTVRAETRGSLSQIFAALFPCASITGAPKARTMEIISQLESSPRRIYTGAIGMIVPKRRASFSVAIRTALIDLERGSVEYGTGGGIVWDSVAEKEHEEARL